MILAEINIAGKLLRKISKLSRSNNTVGSHPRSIRTEGESSSAVIIHRRIKNAAGKCF